MLRFDNKVVVVTVYPGDPQPELLAPWETC